MEILAFYAIAIEPIKVQTQSASQNDRLNVSFVKDTYGNAKKMARKVGKMVIYESQILGLTLYFKFLNSKNIIYLKTNIRSNHVAHYLRSGL